MPFVIMEIFYNRYMALIFFFITDTVDMGFKTPSSEEDLVPPLEHCIRTK